MIKVQDSEFQHSNWNGWMKTIVQMMPSRGRKLTFLQSLKVTLMTTGPSSLLSKSACSSRGTRVTFELPIWLKAMDIIARSVCVCCVVCVRGSVCVGRGQDKGSEGSIWIGFCYLIFLLSFQVGWLSPAKILPRVLRQYHG